MQKQNEKNKSYKKETLQKLKEDEKKCNEYSLKINASTEFFSFHTTNVWQSPASIWLSCRSAL